MELVQGRRTSKYESGRTGSCLGDAIFGVHRASLDVPKMNTVRHRIAIACAALDATRPGMTVDMRVAMTSNHGPVTNWNG